MKIAVISDLHLGPKGVDRFGHHDGEFLKFLTFLEQNFERIILLGDIWETLTGRLPGDPVHQLTLARSNHPEIAARFERPSYTYIHGNHDLIAGALGAPNETVIEADGVRILFTHGHQGDLLTTRYKWVSELGVWLGAWVCRVGMHALYQLIANYDNVRAGVSLDGAQCKFQRWAMGLDRPIDVVVTGHTHVAVSHEHGHRMFLNSGSCSKGRFNFLSIDTRRGEYLVHRTY